MVPHASSYVCVAEVITGTLCGHHCRTQVSSLNLGDHILVEQNEIKEAKMGPVAGTTGY